jgi:hypothetical protein
MSFARPRPPFKTPRQQQRSQILFRISTDRPTGAVCLCNAPHTRKWIAGSFRGDEIPTRLGHHRLANASKRGVHRPPIPLSDPGRRASFTHLGTMRVARRAAASLIAVLPIGGYGSGLARKSLPPRTLLQKRVRLSFERSSAPVIGLESHPYALCAHNSPRITSLRKMEGGWSSLSVLCALRELCGDSLFDFLS